MTAWADGVKLPGDNFFAQYLDKNQIYDFELGALKPSPSGKPGKAAYEPVTIKSIQAVLLLFHFLMLLLKTRVWFLQLKLLVTTIQEAVQ